MALACGYASALLQRNQPAFSRRHRALDQAYRLSPSSSLCPALHFHPSHSKFA